MVAARFGETVIGGAEAVLRELAIGLAQRGWQVDALTTNSTDHYSWTANLDAGVSDDHGVTVRRFGVVIDESRHERGALHARLLAGQQLSLDDQQRWLNVDMRCPDLFHHLLDHGDTYDAVIAGPYHAWTTFAAATVVPERLVVMTCLHDEAEARFELWDPMIGGARELWCLSDPEAELLDRLHPGHSPLSVVGAGVGVPDHYDADGFRARHGITGPFAFYAGRREGAKGWEQLLDGFARAVVHRGLPLQLVTCGAGEVRPPASIAERVFDLGFLDETERDHAMAAASVYVQPSVMESFSRTVCEAWLAGTPVIANAGSEVVAWHCTRSGAGVTYTGDDELAAALELVVANPEVADSLGARGRQYVLDHYQWGDVLDRMEARLAPMVGTAVPSSVEPTPSGDRILMVTPYAPYRDGIGAYALNEVRELRRAGHQVEVLSPGPSAAHHHLDLAGPRGPLALAKRVRAYDRVIVQFHPDVFFSRCTTERDRIRQTAGLLAAFTAARHLDLRLHEFRHDPPGPFTVEGALLRRLWRAADRITVHTATERALFATASGLDPTRIEVIDHGERFRPRVTSDRTAARATLGLDPDATVFVTIGFIQPHKGFDRAVRAFDRAGLARRGAQLHVVGSVRVSEPHYLAHRDELAELCRTTAEVFLHDGFVSDEGFDRWLVAADVIVLPYRHIWSSGVMERARLFDRPVIASRVGGLADQAPEGTVLVDDDDALVAAMEACCEPRPADTVPVAWALAADASLEEIQAEVRRRAGVDPGRLS